MYKIYLNLCSARFPLRTALCLEHELERVQKRALSIICASLDYKEALIVTGIPTIISYNEGICNSTFTLIISDKEHRLNMLLPAANNNRYSSREYRHFAIPKWRLPIVFEIQLLCPHA